MTPSKAISSGNAVQQESVVKPTDERLLSQVGVKKKPKAEKNVLSTKSA